jgi:hypothetical protein
MRQWPLTTPSRATNPALREALLDYPPLFEGGTVMQTCKGR